MPIYEFRCQKCSLIGSEYRPLRDYNKPYYCPQCKGEAKRFISNTANAYISGYPYFDNVLGMEVTDPAHRRKVLKQQGLIERG